MPGTIGAFSFKGTYMIYVLNIIGYLIGGALLLYTSCLWIMLLFNKNKLVKKICDENMLAILSMMNAGTILTFILDRFVVDDFDIHEKILPVTALYSGVIGVILVILFLGGLIWAITSFRDKMIDS